MTLYHFEYRDRITHAVEHTIVVDAEQFPLAAEILGTETQYLALVKISEDPNEA